MKCLLLLAIASLAAWAMPRPAAAYGISQVRFTLVANGSMPTCLSRSRELLEQAGMQVLSTGSFTVGAEPRDGTVLITAYCLPDANLVILSVAGARTADTAPVLERLRPFFSAVAQGRPR